MTQTTDHIQRSYTLNEIDRMRNSVFKIMTNGMKLFTFYSTSGPAEESTWSYGKTGGISHSAMMAQVEDMLRTYMLGGVTPEDLEAKVIENATAYSA